MVNPLTVTNDHCYSIDVITLTNNPELPQQKELLHYILLFTSCLEPLLKLLFSLLQEKLNELYIYRDHYFEKHSLDKADQKNNDVENEMKNTLKLFETLKGMYAWSLMFIMNCVLRAFNPHSNLFVELITVFILQKMLSKRIRPCICT